MVTQPKNAVCTVGLKVPYGDAVQRIETPAALGGGGGGGEGGGGGGGAPHLAVPPRK